MVIVVAVDVLDQNKFSQLLLKYNIYIMKNINYILQYTLYINYCGYNNISLNLKHYLYNDYLNNLCITSPVYKKCIFCDEYLYNFQYYNIAYLYNITHHECIILSNKSQLCFLDQWLKFCDNKFNTYYNIIIYIIIYIYNISLYLIAFDYIIDIFLKNI